VLLAGGAQSRTDCDLPGPGDRIERQLLEPGNRIERELAGGEQHRYQIALSAGEFVRVIVEQEGIDVTVRLANADGDVIATVQEEVRPRGEEPVEIVADKDGTYTLTIAPAIGAVAAGAYAVRVDCTRVATGADRAMQASRQLRADAAALERAGRFDDARVLLERALTTTEDVRGSNDVQVGGVAAQLAGVYRRLAEGTKSESLYQRAIAIMDRTLGAGHPATALTRSQLAILYQRQGERRKAELLLQQALDVIENTVGQDHPWFVSCLATLGNLRDDEGDLDEEQKIVQRGLAITEKIGDTNSVQYAALLNNLGEVARQKQDYPRAAQLFQRSLALGEALLGPDNYSIATALQNLGIVARERKDYATAISYNERALSIRERMVGSDHPDVAHILTNLANIYRATGDYRRALETHSRALHIWENAAGPYQQATLLSVGNIAKTYAATGDMANAIAFQRRADGILERQLALNLAAGSERQKLAFVRAMAERTDRTISLHLNRAPGDADVTAVAALVVLQRKGRVLDAMTDTFAAVRQRVADEGDQSLMDQLKTATAQLARVALSAPGQQRQEERQRTIKELEARKEELEAELSDHSAEFRVQMQPVTLDAVQAVMPDDAALLEFAVFRPFDPRAERNTDAYGAPHYAAYVIRKHAAPAGVDLGTVATVDPAIDALREALSDPNRPGLQSRARAVDEQLMRRLRPYLGDATRLLISPDGNLNRVPFEALVDEHGRYLIERYAMSYLTSGRDLLRMQVPRQSRSESIILADPFFGEPPPRPADAGSQAAAAQRRSVTTAAALSTLYFAPLSGTADEARAIKTLFPEATLVTGRRATKDTLQRVAAPRILHIASHGFFLDDGGRSAAPAAADGNPLLRSGLAFAGANLTREHGEGILTALEASGLDLWGTKLVTLSACDTGIGEVRNGEGVYGLRRAFVLAGAETLVMSLWPVSDYIARDAMVAYYTRLRAGFGRGDALRQAKLAMLRRPNRRHPYYWAGFIQSGEWADLNGKR
jgi:CHAT domain-containing protein